MSLTDVHEDGTQFKSTDQFSDAGRVSVYSINSFDPISSSLDFIAALLHNEWRRFEGLQSHTKDRCLLSWQDLLTTNDDGGAQTLSMRVNVALESSVRRKEGEMDVSGINSLMRPILGNDWDIMGRERFLMTVRPEDAASLYISDQIPRYLESLRYSLMGTIADRVTHEAISFPCLCPKTDTQSNACNERMEQKIASA